MYNWHYLYSKIVSRYWFQSCLTEPGRGHRKCLFTINEVPRDTSGPWFNIKMSPYQYRKSHCGDKTVVRSSYLHNGICYTGKMSSLYWISPLGIISLQIIKPILKPKWDRNHISEGIGEFMFKRLNNAPTPLRTPQPLESNFFHRNKYLPFTSLAPGRCGCNLCGTWRCGSTEKYLHTCLEALVSSFRVSLLTFLLLHIGRTYWFIDALWCIKKIKLTQLVHNRTVCWKYNKLDVLVPRPKDVGDSHNVTEQITCTCWLILCNHSDQAPVPLTIFRSNSKFDQNLQYSSLKCTLPTTTKFCTRHDSVTVVTCAKFRYDRLSIFETRALPILIEFRIRSKCTLPTTTKFCTRHDSVTVVTCAKFRCDRLSIFKTRALPILIEFRIRSKYR